MSDSSYHKILVGVETGADQHGYNILLLTRNRTEPQRTIFQGGVNTLRLADGAILMGISPNHEELQRLTQEGYPFVYIGRRDIPEIEIDWVITDYFSAGVQGTRHLLELGHRHLAYVGEQAAFSNHSTQERWQGCLAAVAEVPGAHITWFDQAAAADTAQLAQLQREGISALICNDARNFREVMQSLPQTGLRIPQDISILALGDTLGDFATSMNVTYVRLNQELVGEMAVKRLVARLEAPAPLPVEHILVPCEFTAGDTTGARGGI